MLTISPGSHDSFHTSLLVSRCRHLNIWCLARRSSPQSGRLNVLLSWTAHTIKFAQRVEQLPLLPVLLASDMSLGLLGCLFPAYTAEDLGDPMPNPSETAAICCPSGFSCGGTSRQSCLSGTRFETASGRFSFTDHSFSARGIQIRWQASDMSKFETPPMTTAPTGKPNRFGWDPAGSLTSLYNCPAITNSTTGTCGTLTGNYYSPAICPIGWTAAHTRPFTESILGPPEAPGETAMLCCPRLVPPLGL